MLGVHMSHSIVQLHRETLREAAHIKAVLMDLIVHVSDQRAELVLELLIGVSIILSDANNIKLLPRGYLLPEIKNDLIA